MTYQNQVIATDPLLAKYYNGMKSLESYYRTMMYDTLKTEFGEDIQQKMDAYGEMKLTDPAGAKAFWKANNLSAYLDRKDELQAKANRMIVELASKLPEESNVLTRADFVPKGATQTAMAEQYQQPQMTWPDWQTVLSEPMQRLIVSFFSGEELPSAAQSELDYLAGQYGYSSGDALLRAIGVSLTK